MNISEMKDSEKSVMLARLCRWRVADHDEQPSPTYKLLIFVTGSGEPLYSTSLLVKKTDGFFEKYMPNLYKPVNMSLLARVIEWACNGTRTDTNFIPKWNDANWEEGYFDNHFDPKNFHASMCRMADEILVQAAQYTELAAGMVTE